MPVHVSITHVYTHTCTHVCIQVYTHFHAHVCTRFDTHSYTHICTYVCIYVCTYVCPYFYAHICTCLYAHTCDDVGDAANTCMLILLSIRIHIMHIFILVPAYISAHISTHKSVHMSIHISTHRSVHMSVHMSTHVCTHVYACLYACICTHRYASIGATKQEYHRTCAWSTAFARLGYTSPCWLPWPPGIATPHFRAACLRHISVGSCLYICRNASLYTYPCTCLHTYSFSLCTCL